MSRRDAIVLRAAAIWMVYVWGTRIWNILGNPAHSTAFKLAHSALALVSVAFGVAIWFVAARNRRLFGADAS
ncbi:MAG: hypothetical protein ACRDIU_07370 [Actinomycetota bacterium]